MFFKKKKALEEREIPVEEAKRLFQSGMSDKDIIKKLKSEGYSYSEIEKAMLSAVKEGISPPSQMSTPQMASPEASFEPSLEPTIMSEEVPEPTENIGIEEVPEEPPETLIEEVIESIVDEKLEGMVSERMKKIGGEIEKAKSELNQLRESMKDIKKPDVDTSRLDEISNEIEDLQARVDGLEKAFKQFLPTLTSHIENLSKIIDELKKISGSMSKNEVEEYMKNKYGMDKETLEFVLSFKRIEEVDYENKILKLIEKFDEGDGVEISKIFEILNLPTHIIESVIDDLWSKGKIYEPFPGKIKIVKE